MSPSSGMTPFAEYVLLGSVLTVAGGFFVWCIYVVKHPAYLARLQKLWAPKNYHTS